MDMLPLAMIQADRSSRNFMHSALPDAPIVQVAQRRQYAVRTRTRMASTLERLAQAVAPKPVTSCSPAH